MRLCAFLEAWVQLVCRREPGRAQGEFAIEFQGVTELIKHHKVAAARSQPWRAEADPERASDAVPLKPQLLYLELPRRLC